MIVIGANQGLLLMSLSRMMRTTIMSAETEIDLLEAWEMMRWVEHLTKIPNHVSRIEEGRLSQPFAQPIFTMYNGWTDPVEHVSHYNQRIAVHSKNETLMCKVFPSSLGPVVMRWFDGLGVGSIDSFKELTREFGSHFITCSRVPRPLDSLLSMSMREGEALKTYSDRY